MVDEDRLDIFLYSVKFPSLLDWFNFIRPCYIIARMDGDKVTAVCILEYVSGKTYWVHFTSFKGYESEIVEACKEGLECAAKLGIKSVLALTPKVYRHVTKLLDPWGFEVLTTVPSACYLAAHDRYVDGCLSKKVLSNV